MIKRQFSPTRFYPSRIIFLVSLLIGFYALKNSVIASYISGTLLYNVIEPVFWICILLIVGSLPRVRSKSKLRRVGFVYWGAFSFAVALIIFQVLGGLIDGLGYSPYSHSLKGMATNIFVVGIALLGSEVVRGYLVNSMATDESHTKFMLISLFMTLLSFQLSKFTSFDSIQNTVIFIAQFLAPEFARNLMATYLVFLGGPLASVIYLGVLQAFHWLSPILPDLKWITAAFIGILGPVFSLTVMQSMYMNEAKLFKQKDKSEESILSWIATTIISISMIWFAVGVFPIYPSVIATGSMKPMIDPGDVILVQKVKDPGLIVQGDVIQFKREEVLISHRIIEVVAVDGHARYRTKGDNNSVQDSELVQEEQIKGTVIKVIPKIGWPTLLIKSKRDVDLNAVEF